MIQETFVTVVLTISKFELALESTEPHKEKGVNLFYYGGCVHVCVHVCVCVYVCVKERERGELPGREE